VSECPSAVNDKLLKALPTKGLLASQLECLNCSFKYPVHLDIFYSVSLALPNIPVLGLPLLIQDCLDKFISSELIHGVKCDICSKSGSTSTFLKSLTFAKLPQLLCFHIHRLVWLSNGTTLKRTEHILAPEYLNMGKYVYSNQISKYTSLFNPLNTKLDRNASLSNYQNMAFDSNLAPKSALKPIRTSSSKYRFRLCATIVHLGDSTSGHFVTYRRGNCENEDIWFYASDTIIRQVTIEEVLSKPAYMLFYERVNTP